MCAVELALVWALQKCALRAHTNHKVCMSNRLKPEMKNETHSSLMDLRDT